MTSGKSPFGAWRAQLRKQGFKAMGTGGRKGTYLGRDAGPVKQAVGVLVSDARGGAFNVQLNINMPLRCAEPPYEVVILEADVGADEVRIVEWWVHDPRANTWWAPDQADAAWAMLNERGIPWLERFSDPRTLIEYFEREYRKHEDLRKRREAPPWPIALGRKLGLVGPPPRSAHREYLLWLSMLYEAQGALEFARERLEAYVSGRGYRASAEEEDRLARHRRALGAAD